MTAKPSVLRQDPDPEGGSWSALPARLESMDLANIEQAAVLGDRYVIIKLREQIKLRRSIVSPTELTEIPAMSRSGLVSALNLGVTLLSSALTRKIPPENEKFMRTMKLQEQARRAELVDGGQLITAQDLASRLGVSPQAISKAGKAGRLFALDCGGGRLLYPAFYSDERFARRDLEKITRALGDIPPSSKWQFFTTPKMSLEGATPLEALQRGDYGAVMITAAGFLER